MRATQAVCDDVLSSGRVNAFNCEGGRAPYRSLHELWSRSPYPRVAQILGVPRATAYCVDEYNLRISGEVEGD